MDQTFDRLSGFDLDQDFSGKNKDIRDDFGDTFNPKKGDLNSFIMAGRKAPRGGDTYSEICDDD